MKTTKADFNRFKKELLRWVDIFGLKGYQVYIDVTEAQNLMDNLWACGLRPTEGSGLAGALAATQVHLKDMKTICFKLLKIEVEK